MAAKTTTRQPGRDADDIAWRKVADTVTPLPGNRRRRASALSRPEAESPAEGVAPREPAGGTAKPGPTPATRAPRPAAAASGPGPADLDTHSYGGISRADARRIRSGKAAIDGRIDLHGMTLAQAELSLREFLIAASSSGFRTVIVVTGKGRGGMGVIRQNLPGWLQLPPLRERVLAYCRAQPRDGGTGAYYVRLRGK